MIQLFPKWMNSLPTLGLFGAIAGAGIVFAGVTYYFTPEYWEVGYQPNQPIPFSHQIHAGDLGMDCRYCHTHVEESRNANIPTTTTCMNCHTVVDEQSGYLRLAQSMDGSSPSPHWDNEGLRFLRDSHEHETSVPWRRVHKLPDYVQFNHSAHLNVGVSCYSCHGRIDEMPVVNQKHSLSMGWCLSCHRSPEKSLIDTNEVGVTDLNLVQKLLDAPGYAKGVGAELKERLASERAGRVDQTPPENCSACHY